MAMWCILSVIARFGIRPLYIRPKLVKHLKIHQTDKSICVSCKIVIKHYLQKYYNINFEFSKKLFKRKHGNEI